MFYNKNILLIGGDSYSANPDDFDFVCTVNRHHPEILNSFYSDEFEDVPGNTRRMYLDLGGCLLFVGNRHQYRGCNPDGPEYEWANIFRKSFKNNINPLMGSFALEYFRTQLCIKSIHVDGYTMYHDPGSPRRLSAYISGSHDIREDISYMLRVKKIDARIRYSKDLNSILSLYS